MNLKTKLSIVWSGIIVVLTPILLQVYLPPTYLVSAEARLLSMMMPLILIAWIGVLYAGHWIIARVLRYYNVS